MDYMSEWVSAVETPEKEGLYLVVCGTADKEIPYRGTAWYDFRYGWSLLPAQFLPSLKWWMPFPKEPSE